jgi:hypothetical protein
MVNALNQHETQINNSFRFTEVDVIQARLSRCIADLGLCMLLISTCWLLLNIEKTDLDHNRA